MPSYLNSNQKKEYESVMQDMHDTFARSIFVYKESLKVIISSDPNFNYLYNNVKGVKQTIRKVSKFLIAWISLPDFTKNHLSTLNDTTRIFLLSP